MVRRTILFFVLGLILPVISFAEIKKTGTPFIRNFPKREYKAGTQSWAVALDKRRFIYFANNEGFAHFNPTIETLPNPDFSTYITKAIALHPDSVFYYGSNYSARNRENKSSYAFIIYFFLTLLAALGIGWLTKMRIDASKRKELLRHIQTFRQKEQEFLRNALIDQNKIIHLKNEKLRAEMLHRNKELANQTMDLIRKNKFLNSLREELLKIKRPGNDVGTNEKIASLIAKIDKDLDHNRQWEIFESAFNEVHEDFLNRLKIAFPNLTPKELRLCAYLRLNLSSKEIATLMNISVRGVEICRYRVRKKLDFERDTNMTSFIINF